VSSSDRSRSTSVPYSVQGQEVKVMDHNVGRLNTLHTIRSIRRTAWLRFSRFFYIALSAQGLHLTRMNRSDERHGFGFLRFLLHCAFCPGIVPFSHDLETAVLACDRSSASNPHSGGKHAPDLKGHTLLANSRSRQLPLPISHCNVIFQHKLGVPWPAMVVDGSGGLSSQPHLATSKLGVP
jgi:hypothetical protein